MNFEIAATGSSHNYTRSYYMNGRDYIISGSCDENIVRICCAQTGKRLRDVHLEVNFWMTFVFSFAKLLLMLTTALLQDTESGNSIFVQSLRGDPFRVSCAENMMHRWFFDTVILSCTRFSL